MPAIHLTFFSTGIYSDNINLPHHQYTAMKINQKNLWITAAVYVGTLDRFRSLWWHLTMTAFTLFLTIWQYFPWEKQLLSSSPSPRNTNKKTNIFYYLLFVLLKDIIFIQTQKPEAETSFVFYDEKAFWLFAVGLQRLWNPFQSHWIL